MTLAGQSAILARRGTAAVLGARKFFRPRKKKPRSPRAGLKLRSLSVVFIIFEITLFPSRFAAPLAAFGGFLVLMMSSQTGFRDTSGWALILPTNSNGNFQPVSGVFYPYLPDLPVARILFLAGLAVTAIGLIQTKMPDG